MPALRQRARNWLRRAVRPRPAATADGAAATNPGWCTCCRAETDFVETGVWLRDQYLCVRCRSIPRLRAINHTLDTYFPEWADAQIHESSPSNDFVRRYCRQYSSSYYYEGVSPGSQHLGNRCENLEQLTFADGTFDLFITQDVFEHVFRPDLASREIMRVVRPGGAHVFTAPKHKGLRATRQRARLDGTTVTHLLDPEYHGNPIGDGRALVTWDYGDDFEVHLAHWCGYPTVTYLVRDRKLGLDGEYLEVFVTRKIDV